MVIPLYSSISFVSLIENENDDCDADTELRAIEGPLGGSKTL